MKAYRPNTVKELRQFLNEMEAEHDSWPDVDKYLGKFEDQPLGITYYEWDDTIKASHCHGVGPLEITNNAVGLGIEFWPRKEEVDKDKTSKCESKGA
jgi:hypothetical protein